MRPQLPRLIPVLDIMGGQVVRAAGGIRKDYRPLQSRLVDSTDPLVVAQAMLSAIGASEVYVADLDAIRDNTLNACMWDLVAKLRNPVWLDGGFGTRRPVANWEGVPGLRPVVGFETCLSPRDFRRCLAEFESKVAFSIDLRDGALVGDWQAWGLDGPYDAWGLARTVVSLGCRTLIVLDLARVGQGGGCGTEELLKDIRTDFPDIELIAGGGINSVDAIERLGNLRVDAILVASAVHDKVIGR